MLKQIKKFIPSPKFTVPVLGLIIAIGAIGQRAQPVLSEQIARLQATSLSKSKAGEEQAPITWTENSSGVVSESISKETRLRRVLDSSSSQSPSSAKVSPGETYTWIQRNNISHSEDLEPELESLSDAQAAISKEKASTKAAVPRMNFPNDNGVFLYGTAMQWGEFNQRYIVFEKQGSKVVGAMYMPASEFNCFQGTLDQSGEIAMTVKGYAGDINQNRVASSGGRMPKFNEDKLTSYAYSVTLQDYHQLDSLKNNDRRILETCKTTFNS